MHKYGIVCKSCNLTKHGWVVSWGVTRRRPLLNFLVESPRYAHRIERNVQGNWHCCASALNITEVNLRGLDHRPYSRQVTEQLPLSGSLHSHQLVYPKAGNAASSENHWFFLKFILMFIVVVYHSPPLVSSFYARLTITSWCVPGE